MSNSFFLFVCLFAFLIEEYYSLRPLYLQSSTILSPEW